MLPQTEHRWTGRCPACNQDRELIGHLVWTGPGTPPAPGASIGREIRHIGQRTVCGTCGAGILHIGIDPYAEMLMRLVLGEPLLVPSDDHRGDDGTG